MAPHSSTLAWKILRTEEPGRLQSMGSLRVRHDWATSLSLFTSCTGEGNGNPLQCSCLENPRDGGTWWAAVYGVAQSRTRLKWLSSSSSRKFSNCWRQCLNQVRIFVSPQIIKNEKYVSKTYKYKKKKGKQQQQQKKKQPLQTSSKFQWLFSVEDRAEGGRDQDVTSLVR